MIVRIRWTPIFGSRPEKTRRFRLPRAKLALGALLLAPGLPVSTIADVPPRPAARAVERGPAETLTAFMKEHDFAEPYHVPEIVEAAARASIPPSLIVCIEFYESSGGKHYDAGTNNPLGWKNGRATFPSVREAIRRVSLELGSGRWYAGKTLQEKVRVYNPRPKYSEKVLGCVSRFEN